jgi:hypothetical protein
MSTMEVTIAGGRGAGGRGDTEGVGLAHTGYSVHWSPDGSLVACALRNTLRVLDGATLMVRACAPRLPQ